MLNSLLGGVEGVLNQALQSLPGGAAPSAVGLTSGSSVAGSGGSSGLVGVLAFLAILLLGGKYLWSASAFLRPNSALRLAIERPG